MANEVRVAGYKYPTNTTTEYQRFKSEYFSGADVRIYFGDMWVDEITNLQFTLQEQVAPIFGYASYTWDTVARGNRYIQGSFTINFKESYYLHSIVERLSSRLENARASRPIFDVNQWKEGLNVEHMVEWAHFNKTTFDALADDFEKSLWGQGNKVKETNARSEKPFFTKSMDSVMGDSGFNILIGYGPMNEKNGMTASETVHSLIGVQLTGCSQVIGGDGQPIQEQYTFIAKDLDGNMAQKG